MSNIDRLAFILRLEIVHFFERNANIPRPYNVASDALIKNIVALLAENITEYSNDEILGYMKYLYDNIIAGVQEARLLEVAKKTGFKLETGNC